MGRSHILFQCLLFCHIALNGGAVQVQQVQQVLKSVEVYRGGACRYGGVWGLSLPLRILLICSINRG